MKINELQPKTGNIDLIATVTHVDAPREFEKAGSKGKVGKATIHDETGTCKLTLWNEQTEFVKKGAKIKITGGWADEYKGELQLSTGKFGSLEVLEHDETIIEAVTHQKKEEEKEERKSHLKNDDDIYSADDEIVFDADEEDII